MPIGNLLKDRRTAILKRWRDSLTSAYPLQGAQFLSGQKDRFANPVGHAFKTGLEELFDGLLARADAETLEKALDRILAVRAVQDFTAAQAVGFVFHLKNCIREELKEELHDMERLAEYVEFSGTIDGMALLAFNVYMKRRDKLHDLRATEVSQRMRKFIDRMNVMYERSNREAEEKEEHKANQDGCQ